MNGLLCSDVKIADVTLAKTFKISIEKFDAICESLIHESNESDWHLNEGEHFQVTNHVHNARSFTPEGVILLAKYVEDEIDGRNIFRKIISLIDRSSFTRCDKSPAMPNYYIVLVRILTKIRHPSNH